MTTKNITENVLNALEKTGKDLSKTEKVLFASLVEDNKKMEERMTALEKKVDTVEKKVDAVISDQQVFKNQLATTQSSIENLTKLIQTSIDLQKEKTKIITGMLHNKWFWLFAIIAIILIAGGSAADLAGIVKFEK